MSWSTDQAADLDFARRARCSAISVGDSSARTRFSSISQSLERKVAALDWRVGRPLQKTRETHTLTHTRHSPRDRSMTWVTSTDSMARIWLKIHSYNNETKMYFRLIVPPSEKPLRRDNSNANPASGFQVVRCPGAGRALCGAQWRYADHQLGEEGAAPSWQMIMGRGGTNVRFAVSQQTTEPVYARNRDELIRTRTHRAIV